jgi:oligopeptide/dipeptide ABC transporter ATP-binding protein
MYAGQIVETAPADELFARPCHPYTRALLAALPSLETRGKRLATIPGQVPSALDFPPGCRFHPRCPEATPECARATPALAASAECPARSCRCFRR